VTRAYGLRNLAGRSRRAADWLDTPRTLKSDAIPPAGFEQRGRQGKLRRCSFQLLLVLLYLTVSVTVSLSSYSRDVTSVTDTKLATRVAKGASSDSRVRP